MLALFASHGLFDLRVEDHPDPVAELRRLVDQWRQVAPYYYGDYYPLTSYSQADDAWMAWQFHRPEAGEGMVQAFRRADSPFEAARFRLNALDLEKNYKVWNTAGGQPVEQSGKDLMERGALVKMEDRPGAVVIRYQAQP